MFRALVLTLGLGLASVSALAASTVAHAEEALPTASELLKAMDDNLQFDTRTSTSTMVVDDGKRPRTYKMVTYGRGQDEAAIEYVLPEREKGTKMLKNGDQLWLYLPRSERVQKISGHMMRQGMMGSDVSYEDLMSSDSFEDQYKAEVTGAETIEGRKCWRMEAIAKDDSVTYPKRVMWIDAETLMPLKQELFALSGMKMKTWMMSDIREVEGRQVAFKMTISDELKQGSSTTMSIEEVTFGVKLEDEVFSRRWLERR
jgi:outer membrane lipoprotein-sorting protein